LVEEYAATLGVPLDFQNFEQERTHLATEYGPPHGVFLLAQRDGDFSDAERSADCRKAAAR
jgi:hypothetical protein